MNDEPEFSRYSAESVEWAIDEAKDMVCGGLDLGEAHSDFMEVMGAAALMLLKDPQVTLEDVISQHYPSETLESMRKWWG